MAHRLIPLTPPLFFHFTLPLSSVSDPYRNVWIWTWISGPSNWITDTDLDPALFFSVFEGVKKFFFF
jgi:hypothetical protein